MIFFARLYVFILFFSSSLVDDDVFWGDRFFRRRNDFKNKIEEQWEMNKKEKNM